MSLSATAGSVTRQKLQPVPHLRQQRAVILPRWSFFLQTSIEGRIFFLFHCLKARFTCFSKCSAESLLAVFKGHFIKTLLQRLGMYSLHCYSCKRNLLLEVTKSQWEWPVQTVALRYCKEQKFSAVSHTAHRSFPIALRQASYHLPRKKTESVSIILIQTLHHFYNTNFLLNFIFRCHFMWYTAQQETVEK